MKKMHESFFKPMWALGTLLLLGSAFGTNVYAGSYMGNTQKCLIVGNLQFNDYPFTQGTYSGFYFSWNPSGLPAGYTTQVVYAEENSPYIGYIYKNLAYGTYSVNVNSPMLPYGYYSLFAIATAPNGDYYYCDGMMPDGTIIQGSGMNATWTAANGFLAWFPGTNQYLPVLQP